MGERKYLSSFRRSRWWRWTGKCLWDEPSASGISPELGKVFKCSCSGPPHHCQNLGVLCASLGALGRAGSCGCPGKGPRGLAASVHHHPQCSALAGIQPGLLCHHARRPSCHLSCPQAVSHLQPGLAGGHSDPSSTGRGMLALPGLAGGAACL